MARRRILDRFPEVLAGGPRLTLLGEGMTFEGQLSTADHARIAGKVEGSVRAGRVAVLEQGGVIKGSLEADVVIVEGALDGSCTAVTQFELGVTGRIRGDVDAPLVALADGSFLQGKVRTRGRDPHIFVEHRKPKRPPGRR